MAEKREVLLDIQVRNKDAEKRLAELEKRLKQNSESQKLLNKQLKDGKVSLDTYSEATTAVKLDSAELRKEQSSLRRQILNTTKATDSAEGSNEQLKAQLSLLTAEYNKLSKSERKNTEVGKELEIQTRAISDELKDNEKAVGDNRRNVGNYQSALDGLGGVLDKVIPGFGNITKGASEAGDKFGSLAGSSTKLGGVVGKVAKKLGGPLVAALVAVVAAGVKAGEAIVQITREFDPLLKQVNALTGATGGSLDNLTGQIKGLADTFGQDFNEVLRAANTTANAFGISIEEALDQIGEGFINGADASKEYLSILNEYPAQLEEVGLSFEQANALILVQTQEGIFSDKGIDAIKEAKNRLRELTPATRDALNGIGLVADDIEEGLRTRSVEIFDVIQQVGGRLGELQANSPEVGAAIADIFGGPGEDAGLEFIKTLGKIEGGLEDVTLVSDEYRESQEKDVEVSKRLNTAKSELASSFAPLVNAFDRFGNRVLLAVISSLNSVLSFFTITLPSAFEGAVALVENFGTNLKNQIKTIGLNIEIAAAEIESFFSSSDEVEQRLRNLRGERDAVAKAGKEYGQVFGEAFNKGVAEREAEAQGRAAIRRAKAAAEEAAAARNSTGPAAATGPTPEDAAKAQREAEERRLEELKIGITQRINEEKLGQLRLDQDRLISDERREELTIAREKRLIQLKAQLALAGLESESIEAKLIEEQAAADIAQIQIDANNKVIANRVATNAEEQRLIAENAAAEAAAADARVAANLQAEEAKRAEAIETARIQKETDESTLDALVFAAGAAREIAGENVAVAKAAGAIEAGISTYVAANKALATLPPPASFIVAGATVALGLKNVAEILSAPTSFADGGFTGDGFGTPDSSGHKVAGVVHAGEYVVPKKILANPVAASMVGQLEKMRGYAGGGFVGVQSQAAAATAQVQQQISLDNIDSAIKSMPAPIVDVRDIVTTQKRVEVKQSLGKL